MIRLLTKSEIASAKATDRSKEIAEGMKLSGRVDNLRKLAAEEETKLSQFRAQTLEAIHKEIDALEKEKEAIEKELIVLREEKALGMKKVENELLSVTSFRMTLDQREAQLNQESSIIESKRKEALKLLQDAKDDVLRTQSHKEEAARLHLLASEDRKEASATLSEARKIEDKTKEEKAKIEHALSLRIEELFIQEKRLNEREKVNAELAEELRIKAIQLEDQRQTLERALKRNG